MKLRSANPSGAHRDVSNSSAEVPKEIDAEPCADAGRIDQSNLTGRLVELIRREAHGDLFHDAEEAFVALKVSGHIETWCVESERIRNHIIDRYFTLNKIPPGRHALDQAIETLRAIAKVGKARAVGRRLAESDGVIYLDTVDPEWSVIEMSATDWGVCAPASVRFTRSENMLPLPRPVRGGSIEMLRDFVNLKGDDDFKLLVAWLLTAMMARGPYYLLVLQGEQGSAKSTAARVIRALLDPSKVPSIRPPKNELDLLIAAKHSRILSLDNVSRISSDISDALCSLLTGAGLSKKKLYTDVDEASVAVSCPVIINSIDEIVRRPDLADRAIILTLPSLPASERKPERIFWDNFERVRPQILGALCTAVSCALRRLNEVSNVPRELPRMADAALWITAAEPALGWADGTFLEVDKRHRTGNERASAESDPLGHAIMVLMQDHKEWRGSPSALLRTLRDLNLGVVLPQAPNSLSGELRRIEPILRTAGVNVHNLGNQGHDRGRVIEIWRTTERPEQSENDDDRSPFSSKKRRSNRSPNDANDPLPREKKDGTVADQSKKTPSPRNDRSDRSHRTRNRRERRNQ